MYVSTCFNRTTRELVDCPWNPDAPIEFGQECAGDVIMEQGVKVRGGCCFQRDLSFSLRAGRGHGGLHDTPGTRTIHATLAHAWSCPCSPPETAKHTSQSPCVGRTPPLSNLLHQTRPRPLWNLLHQARTHRLHQAVKAAEVLAAVLAEAAAAALGPSLVPCAAELPLLVSAACQLACCFHADLLVAPSAEWRNMHLPQSTSPLAAVVAAVLFVVVRKRRAAKHAAAAAWETNTSSKDEDKLEEQPDLNSMLDTFVSMHSGDEGQPGGGTGPAARAADSLAGAAVPPTAPVTPAVVVASLGTAAAAAGSSPTASVQAAGGEGPAALPADYRTLDRQAAAL